MSRFAAEAKARSDDAGGLRSCLKKPGPRPHRAGRTVRWADGASTDGMPRDVEQARRGRIMRSTGLRSVEFNILGDGPLERERAPWK